MSKILSAEIEKASREYANITHDRPIDEEERYYKDYQKYDGFIAGANWQKEQMQEHTKQNIEALRSELKESSFWSNHYSEDVIMKDSIDSTINNYLENIK